MFFSKLIFVDSSISLSIIIFSILNISPAFIKISLSKVLLAFSKFNILSLKYLFELFMLSIIVEIKPLFIFVLLPIISNEFSILSTITSKLIIFDIFWISSFDIFVTWLDILISLYKVKLLILDISFSFNIVLLLIIAISSKFKINNSFSIVSNLLSYSFVTPQLLFSYFKVPVKKFISVLKGISKSLKGNLYSVSFTPRFNILNNITTIPSPPFPPLFIPPFPIFVT